MGNLDQIFVINLTILSLIVGVYCVLATNKIATSGRKLYGDLGFKSPASANTVSEFLVEGENEYRFKRYFVSTRYIKSLIAASLALTFILFYSLVADALTENKLKPSSSSKQGNDGHFIYTVVKPGSGGETWEKIAEYKLSSTIIVAQNTEVFFLGDHGSRSKFLMFGGNGAPVELPLNTIPIIAGLLALLIAVAATAYAQVLRNELEEEASPERAS